MKDNKINLKIRGTEAYSRKALTRFCSDVSIFVFTLFLALKFRLLKNFSLIFVSLAMIKQ